MSERREAVFVVRMWSEPSRDAEPIWRGSVADVASSGRVCFSNLGTMCEFMLERRRLVRAVEANIDSPDDSADPADPR